MSDKGKGRSTKLIAKTRYEVWLWNLNYDWLYKLAHDEGVTMARKLNEILHDLATKRFHVE